MKYIEMESFGKENCNGLEVSDPKLESFGTKDAKVEELEGSLVGDSVPKFESFGRESCSELSISEGRSCKVDGRSKPRTQKQIESYSNNFGKRDSLATKVEELDSRLSFLQRVVLSLHRKHSD